MKKGLIIYLIMILVSCGSNDKKSIFNETDDINDHDRFERFITSFSIPFTKKYGEKVSFVVVPGIVFLPNKLGEKNTLNRIGFPHEIKGQGIYAYVTLNSGVEPTDTLRTDLVKLVRKEIGPIATLDAIQWATGLPKTRSGKIMRRILRKIAENQVSSIGDTSTLADPSVVENLIENRISTEK